MVVAAGDPAGAGSRPVSRGGVYVPSPRQPLKVQPRMPSSSAKDLQRPEMPDDIESAFQNVSVGPISPRIADFRMRLNSGLAGFGAPAESSNSVSTLGSPGGSQLTSPRFMLPPGPAGEDGIGSLPSVNRRSSFKPGGQRRASTRNRKTSLLASSAIANEAIAERQESLIDLLFEAVLEGDLEAVMAALENGVDVNGHYGCPASLASPAPARLLGAFRFVATLFATCTD